MRATAGSRGEPAFVSVIVAVKNAGPWIGAQLQGLADQDATVPFEVIVADNGSVDNTRVVVESFRSVLPQLVIVDASGQRGQRGAQRAAVDVAKGDLFLFLDGDDVCRPGWVRAMSTTATSCDMVAGAVEVTSLNDSDMIRARPQVETTGVSRAAESLSAGPYAIGATFGVWRHVWSAVDDPPRDLPASCRGGGEDRDLSWSVRRAGFQLDFCAEEPLAYRLRPPGPATRRQMRSYGIADAALAKRYHDLGARGDSPRQALRKYVVLLPRALKAKAEGDEAHWARSELAVALGRLEGSLRFRVLCL